MANMIKQMIQPKQRKPIGRQPGASITFISAACRIPRIALDYIWRPCLHLRSRVLLGEASRIQPFDLAPFCERGNRLSFLRRPLVCRVGRQF